MPTLSIFDPETIKDIIFVVFGGLGIFLYGIDLMSSSLKTLAGNKLKLLVEKATSTPLMGILTGMIVTVLIQSSSATTVIVIGLISAGLMTLKQSLGVLMGANIGTTITSFLIGLNISAYAFPIVAIGAILVLFFTARKLRLSGNIILGFGLLFVGLELISLGLKPLSKMAWFESSMISMSTYPILGVLVGTGLTTLVQSSSASIGVLQQIFSTGAINLNAALPILLGCNIGTTITALLASLSGTTEAKQASIFHLFFNLFGAIIFIIFLTPYTNLFLWVENRFLGINNKLTIAFAHILFNMVTTIVVIFLVKYFMLFIQKILPIKKDSMMLLVDKLNIDLIESSPILALESAKGTVYAMGEIILEMFQITNKYKDENNSEYFNLVMDLEDKVDYYDHKIHDYLMEMQSVNLSSKETTSQVILLDTIQDFERIADHCVNLVEFYQSRYELDCIASEAMSKNITTFFDKVLEQTTNAVNCFKTNNRDLAKEVVILEKEIDTLERLYRRAQLFEKHENYDNCNDMHFVDILSNLERISDHCHNIAENVINPHYMSRERLSPSK